MSCSTTPTPISNICPNIPQLLEISREIEEQTPLEVVEIVTENYLRLAQHIKDLRAVAGCQ